MSAAAPTAAAPHWPALDGMRGLAVLAVMGFHFGLPGLGGGYLGVDVFFVVSGCVVTVSWLRLRAAGRSAREFFARRARRLLPGLFAYLAVALAWNIWQDRALFTEANGLVVAAAAQVVNLVAAFGEPGFVTTTHLWSLSIEWQFYLLLPLLLAVRGHSGATRRTERIVLVLAITSIALRPLLGVVADVTPWKIYHWTPTRLDGLTLGVLVGLWLGAERRRVGAGAIAAASGALVITIALAPPWWQHPREALYLATTVVGITTAVVVRGITTATIPASLERLLASRPLRWVGERSYSIYLWHFFVGVIVIAGNEDWQGPAIFAGQVVASLVVSVIAYELVERPMRQRRVIARGG